jgi:Domain of unknown function (DUF4157)
VPRLAAPKRKRAAPAGQRADSKARRKRARKSDAAGSPAVGALQPNSHGLIQTKLRVNEPGDKYEREADHMADRVMQSPAPPSPAGATVSARDRAEDERRPALQREKTEKDDDKARQPHALQREAKKDEEPSHKPTLQREKTEKDDEKTKTPALQRASKEDETRETPRVQRKEAGQKKDEEKSKTSSLQRKEGEEDEHMQHKGGQRRHEVTHDFESALKELRRAGGQPLPDFLRAFFEPRFGRSLGDIRVHVGRDAAELAGEANARAFTVGSHIVFGAGEYRPGLEQGQRLIAHELTHVFQQRGGLHSVQREVGPDRTTPAEATARLPTVEELRAAFRLDSGEAPPSVRAVAVALLRAALSNRYDAERLRPLADAEGEAASFVRRIVSGGFTLELAAVRGEGGVERGWKLTDRNKNQTFVLNPGGRQLPNGATGAGTITLTSPLAAEQYPQGTLVAGLATSREGKPPEPSKSTPLVPETVPAGTVPVKAPPLKTQPPANDKAKPADAERAEPAKPVKSSQPAEASAPTGVAQPGEAASKGAAATEEAGAAEGAGGAPAAEPEHAPLNPEEDPEFQQTLTQIKQTRRAEGKHDQPRTKLEETKKASVIPEEKQHARNDRDKHLATIGQVADDSKKNIFTPDSFKAEFRKVLAEIRFPKNEDQAKAFKEEKPVDKAKEKFRGQVDEQKGKVTGDLSKEVESKQPPKSDAPVDAPGDLKQEAPGARPANISAQAAAPKPRLDSEISMDAESRSLDDKMSENGLTDEQLAESNEKSFVQALDSKREAQEKCAEAPGQFREQEQQTLAAAQSKAGKEGAAGVGAMFGAREKSFGSVYTSKDSTATQDKAEQERVVGELKKIYDGTKADVDTILNDLTTEVNNTFSTEVEKAKEEFEKTVEKELDDIYGWTRVDDWLFGEDTDAIELVFSEQRFRFKLTMERVIDDLAVLIADKLNAAIERIRKGRADAETFYSGLNDKQKKLADDAMESFRQQFDTLEEGVRDKEHELADALAQTYKSSLDALRESFDKIKAEVSKGWINKAIDFIEDVASAIKKLGELLLSVLTRVANVISDILAHPIRFLENLAKGVGDGFKMFVDKIDEYLLAGFFDWLGGAVGEAGITLPDKFDAAGIFSLVTQVLGLSYETFRTIAVNVWGKEAVEFIEKGVAVAEKGLEIFYIVRDKGLGGLWDYVVETVGNHVSEIVDKAKETIFYETIKKALVWIAGLFNPVGAFIKAAQAIYAGLRFLVDNIDRIAEIVDAFLTSIEKAVAGDTDIIAKKIVKALRGVIVIAIDFLAKLLGLGNLGEKIRKILAAIRKPVERAIEWVLKKLRPLVLGVLSKLGVAVEGPKKKDEGTAGQPLSHEQVLDKVVGLMSEETKAENPSDALAEKKEQAQNLIKEYQPMLKQGMLQIVITDKGSEDVEKHAAVDFEVSASPGKKGEAPVRLNVEDKEAARKRFAHARSLKKFTDEKGFTVEDWAGTFTKLSQSTHYADLRFGVEEKIVKKKDSTYFFKDESDENIVERGAAAIRDQGRDYEPFVDSRFGVKLIQEFLAGRKIPGVPPDTFTADALVVHAAERAVEARALRKIGSTNTWMLPKTPARRDLPAGWGGTTHIRPRFYDRGAGFPEIASERVEKVIDNVVKPNVDKQLDNIERANKRGTEVNWTPWQTLIDKELAKPNEKFSEARAAGGYYYERARYHLDHVKPLAEHWNNKGYDSGQEERIAANQGKRGGFQVLEASVNESKGSGGINYQLWVGPDFTSPTSDEVHADGDELFVIKTKP